MDSTVLLLAVSKRTFGVKPDLRKNLISDGPDSGFLVHQDEGLILK